MNQETALSIAVSKGHIEIINRLIEKKAEINTAHNNGNTLLMIAVLNQDLEVVKTLLNAKIDINAQNKQGNTALMIAAEIGNMQIFNALMEKNPLDLKNNNKATAFAFSLAERNLDISSELMKKFGTNCFDVNAVFDEGKTLLMKCVSNVDIHIINFLLNKGVNIHAKDIFGNTAMDYAKKMAGHFDESRQILQLLWNHSTFSYKTDVEGNTPLIQAAKDGNVDAIAKLLESKDTDANSVNMNGETALLIAYKNNNSDACRLLIPITSDVAKIITIDEITFFEACKNGMLSIVEYILKQNKNIDVNVEDENGNTPLKLASKWGHPMIVEYLITNGAKIEALDKTFKQSALYVAASSGQLKSVKMLLKHKASVHTVEGSGDDWTPLHVAVYKGFSDIMNVLLDEKGSDINKPDKKGQTLLHIAVKYDYAGIVKNLILRGAKVDVLDNNGKKPQDLIKNPKTGAVLLPVTSISHSKSVAALQKNSLFATKTADTIPVTNPLSATPKLK